MQLRRHSFLEACLNTASGFVVSFAATFFAFPALGIVTSAAQNFWITCFFTVISIIRSYIWRRVFNQYTDMRGDGEGI